MEELLIEFNVRLKCFLSLCESPIERQFAINFIRSYFDASRFGSHNLEFIFDYYQDEVNGWFEGFDKILPNIEPYQPGIYISGLQITSILMNAPDISGSNIRLLPQYKIKSSSGHFYRVDFLLLFLANDNQIWTSTERVLKKIVIECDGHEWHSTRKQKDEDNKRDRDLSSLGYQVLRYSGSEIFNNRDFIKFMALVEEIEENVFHELREKNEKIRKEMQEDIKKYTERTLEENMQKIEERKKLLNLTDNDENAA